MNYYIAARKDQIIEADYVGLEQVPTYNVRTGKPEEEKNIAGRVIRLVNGRELKLPMEKWDFFKGNSDPNAYHSPIPKLEGYFRNIGGQEIFGFQIHDTTGPHILPKSKIDEFEKAFRELIDKEFGVAIGQVYLIVTE